MTKEPLPPEGDPEDAEPTPSPHALRRVRRSNLLNFSFSEADAPTIKLADTPEEYREAFKLAHDVYVRSHYITENPQFPYYYTDHSLLDRSCVFVFKARQKVLAATTEIFDTPDHGLPMDALYKDELDALRDQGRRIAEISSLVTAKSHRMINLTTLLCKAVFDYSITSDLDDLCVITHPKHAAFYMRVLMFEAIGPVRPYDKVHAPAMPLRANMRTIGQQLRRTYGQAGAHENLHAFFCHDPAKAPPVHYMPKLPQKNRTPRDVLNFFARHKR